jgi:peptide-methionine (R)-S-oxide reductase
MITKRQLLVSGASVLALTSIGGVFGIGRAVSAKSDEAFEVTKTEAEWRKILTPEQFAVLREEGTERPGSSPLNAEKREGTFNCAGCDLAVYDSKTKFESGTGWPSFWAAIDVRSGPRRTTHSS